jgi:hypothetical protein
MFIGTTNTYGKPTQQYTQKIVKLDTTLAEALSKCETQIDIVKLINDEITYTLEEEQAESIKMSTFSQDLASSILNTTNYYHEIELYKQYASTQ